jgi:hypothetical protein
LLIRADGAKVRRVWRFEYRLHGKESTLGFGTYPQTTIDQARRRAADAREKIEQGDDPAKLNRDKRAAQVTDASLTFGRIGAEYIQTKLRERREKTRKKHERLFGTCLAKLHTKPLSAIQTRDILASADG